MKSSCFLLLCVGFVLSIVLVVTAQELSNGLTWEQLKKSSSTSIVTVANNCPKWINEARSSCKASIDHAAQLISQKKENLSIQTLILQETIDEVSNILKSVSSNVSGQLAELGNRFQKRLEEIINANNSIQVEIIDELKGIMKSPADQKNDMLANIQQLFSPSYAPLIKMKETIGSELGKISEASELELGQLQKVILDTLNNFNNGIAIAKEVQISLKKQGQLPQNWASNILKNILTTCAQITNTLQVLGKNSDQSNSQASAKAKNLQNQTNKAMTMRQTVDDEISLMEEENELDDEDNQSGIEILERSKKKIRTKLVAAVKDIKKATDAKSIDLCTDYALQNYGELLGDVSCKIHRKIVDFVHQFIKLYKSVSEIMESINQGMNENMIEIFNDQSIDTTDFYYNNIKKYFADTYLTEAKISDLHTKVSNCMKTAKTRKALQKQITQQLSTVTSDLVKEIDTMKSTTLYIILELRKGVTALQNLKNKSNVSGIRSWFNFYNGKTDLAQVKKIMHIINAININSLFEQEITSLQSTVHIFKCDSITQTIQQTLSQRTSELLTELEQKKNLREIESVRSKFLQTFNSVITVYKLKVKKVIKQMVVKFINIYEETLIIVKRQMTKNVHLLDAVLDNETRNIDSDIPIFALYIARSTEINIEQDTGISIPRKFKNARDAKSSLKNNINQINKILNSHIIEMKMEIQKIMTTITTESSNLQQLQRDVQSTDNYTIDLNKFARLEYLMRLANTLKISHGDITNAMSTNLNSSNEQLASYFDSAIERLRSEKQNAQLEFEKCTNMKQVEVQVVSVTTYISQVISDTVMEIRSDINRYTSQYKTALSTYIKCTKHETLLKVLERGRTNNNINISLSQTLQTYLQDKYSQTILQAFLSSAYVHKDIQQSKQLVMDSLSLTIKQVENDVGFIQSESSNTIFNTFKQAIQALEMVNSSESKNRLDGEQTQALVLVSRLLKILQDNAAINVDSTINEAKEAIYMAKESFQNEYSRSVEALSKATDEITVQTEIRNAIDSFESIYNTMRQSVKTKMETLSIEYYEKFKAVNAGTTITKKVIQEIMGGIYNNEFVQKEEYQTFSSLTKSESYTSSLAINLIYNRLKTDKELNVANGQSLHLLNSMKNEASSNINQIEGMVEYISNMYGKSINIIVSINEGKVLEITDVNDISILTQSLLIYQNLLQVHNRADFARVQRVINEEYEQAVQAITSTNNEDTILETISQSIEKYDTVTNILENEVTQKFMKITSEFTNNYEIVMQRVIAQKNEELLDLLQNIIEKKMCDNVSEKYRTFESYINSLNFRSTTFAKDSYKDMPTQSTTKDASLEQLKALTSKVNEFVHQLDTHSQFANEQFLKATRILECIQSNNFQLNAEQVQIITECVMITQMVSKHNFSNMQSTTDKEWEAVSTAKKSIDEEYSSAMDAIKSTKEKVIIEQIISTSIYKYDDTYNNLREEMKQAFSTFQIDFTSTYETITEILQIQNIPMYARLQKIQNSPTTVSTKYTKFESYIKSETFTSYSLIRNELLKLEQGKNVDKMETYMENLNILTKTTNKQIEEMNLIQKYVTETLRKSTELLQSIETDVNIQLNKEQFITLCETFRISKIVEALISSKEQIEEKFLLAERSINDIYENAINEIQTVGYNVSITNSIQQYTSIYNNLKVNVQEIFIHKSTFFINTLTTVSRSILLQNSDLFPVFENIKKKMDVQQSSEDYQEFITYINSDKFSSSSYITYIYQNLKIQEKRTTTDINQRNIEQLTELTNIVKQIITEMNSVHQLVLQYFNENIECLKGIDNGASSILTQEQTVKLTECVGISEIVTYTCVNDLTEKEIIFETAESNIIKEYETTVRSIIQVETVSEAVQIIDTNIEYYEDTYNVLRENVKNVLIQTSNEFSKSYTILLENLKSQNRIELYELMKDLQSTKKMTGYMENYKKCENFFSSESFKSCSWIFQNYNKNSQKKVKINKETYIEELQNITSEVKYQIAQARYSSKYVAKSFQSSVEIFKLIESGIQQLTQEQIRSLTETKILSEQINCKFSTKSLQEENIYTTTQTNIISTYKESITIIQTTKDTKTLRENILQSARSYNKVYNNYRSEVKVVFTKTVTQFSQTFDKIIKQTMNGPDNAELQSTLQNIKNKRINIEVSEEYTRFESYISTEKFVSTNVIKRACSKLETQVIATDQLHKQGLYQLKLLTNEVDTLVNELNNQRQFVSETIQRSTTILKSIETNADIKLTQEQITTLIQSVLITETILIETSSVSQTEEKILITAENTIETEEEKAINIVRSTKDTETVKATITTTVKNYDKTYNQAREEVKQVFIRVTTEFNQTYTTIIEVFKTQKNIEIQNLLRNIQSEKTDINISQKYRHFESYLNSEAFTTILLATHSYQNIQMHTTSTNLIEDGVKDIESIANEVQTQLNKMSIVQKYVSWTLQKSTNILKTLESNIQITELTEYEITILTESIMILEIINTEFNSKTIEKEEIFSTAEIQIDQQHDTALNKIQSATNEETLKQAMQESVEIYDTTVKSIQEEVKHTFTEATTEFTSTFNNILSTTTSNINEAVRNVLKDIQDHRVETEVSEEYTIFEEFISSETFSSFSITESYTEIQKEEAIMTEKSVNSKTIGELEKLTTKVNQYITKTHTVRKYITRVFERSTKILTIVEQEENIQLTKEERNVLSESLLISEKLSSQSNTTVDTREVITKECEKAVKTVQLAQSKEEVNEIIDKNIHNYSKVYNEKEEHMKTTLTHTSKEFSKSYNTILEKSCTPQILEEIEHSKEEIKQDQKLQEFKSYIENRHLSSAEKTNKIYTNISGKNSENTDFKEQGIKELQDLTTNVNQEITMMNEYQKYATENIAKGQEILQHISENKNINLNKEQIISITRSIEITETITQSFTIEEIHKNVQKQQTQRVVEMEREHMETKEVTMDTEEEYKMQTNDNTTTINEKISADQSQEMKRISNESKTVKSQDVEKYQTNMQKSTKVQSCDLTEVQKVIKEDHDTIVNLIETTENEEKVERVVKEHIESLDKTYCVAKQSLKSEIAQKSNDYISHLQTTIKKVENTEVSQVLNKVTEEEVSYEMDKDEELENFITCVRSKTFQANSIKENINLETRDNSNIKEESIKEIENMDKVVNENLQMMEDTSKFISENLQKSDTILKKIESEKEYKLNEEEIRQIARSTRITEVLHESEIIHLDSISAELDKTSITISNADNLPVYLNNQDKLNEQKITKVVDRNKSRQHATQENQEFAIYQSTMEVKVESDSQESAEQATMAKGGELGAQAVVKAEQLQEKNKELIAEKETMPVKNKQEQENLERGETLIVDQDSEKNMQSTVLKQVQSENKKLEVNIDTKQEKCEQSTLPIQNQNENEVLKIEKLALETENNMVQEKIDQKRPEQSTLPIQNENQELKMEKQASKIEKNVVEEEEFNRIQTKSFRYDRLATKEESTIKENEDENADKDQQEAIKEATQDSNKAADEVIQDHTVDFRTVQHNIEEENNALVNSIKQTNNEEQVKEIMKEYIQTLDKTYENTQYTVEKEMTHTSEDFFNTFQSTLSHTQNKGIQNRLNEIMNENVEHSIQEDEEMQRFESNIKSKTFSSTSTIMHMYESMETSETSETTSDVKEKSIHDVEAINNQINENLHTMEETKKFVSENLRKSADILKKVETNNEAELNEEEVQQIAKSIKITKVLYESETSNSNTQTIETRSIDTPTNHDMTVIQNTMVHDRHKSVKMNEERSSQSTFTSTQVGNESALNNLLKDNCLSVEPEKYNEDKSKVLEKVSTQNLLVKWEVTKSKDKLWPSECRNISWTSEKFVNNSENEVFVEEIGQILQITRNLIENTANMELKKLKLNRRVWEDLSATTVCVNNIYNILQRLSIYVYEEMERFSSTMVEQIKAANVKEKLETVTATMEDDFVDVAKAFFDLQYGNSSDMLDLIDQQYENEICDTVSKSRKVAVEKLEKLQSTVNTVLDNIDCLVLTMLDTFVSGKLAIENMIKGRESVSVEDLKNCQKLCTVLDM